MSTPAPVLSSRKSDRRVAPAPRRRDRALEAAISGDGIAMRFQPQFEIATGRIIGVEALARWDGEPCASRMFGRAARGGLHQRLSRFAQRKALQMAGCWPEPLRSLGISINLVAEDLASADYDRWLLAEISAAGLAAERVTVEITESSLLADQAMAAAQLDRLRVAGVGVALDDFGTGYASMAWLTSLPLDRLKLDRSLIAGLVESERAQIVVRAMIAMAQELDLRTVVEGVETTGQLALLKAWGCECYQGFLGSPALDEAGLAARVIGSF